MSQTSTLTLSRRQARRDTLRQAAAAVWLPWLTCRVVVGAALALARYEVDHLRIGDAKAVDMAHAGLVAWDAGWYTSIAAHGYRAAGLESLRFFPLFPLAVAALHHVTLVPIDGAAVLLANTFGFAATMALWVLVRSELGDHRVAARSAWLFSLVPAAFTFVLGYSDSLLVTLAVACFFCLRRQHWLVAAGLGFLAGTARPLGCLLLVPAACEAARHLSRVGWRNVAARLLAVVAPVLGLVAFLAWAGAALGSFTRPLTLQDESSRHGHLADPLVTAYHDVAAVVHGHHVGTALHVPWVIVAVAMLVVTFRRLPVSYGAFALAVLAASTTGTNLDSFERYALSAFPLVMAAATLLESRRVEVCVLVLCAVGMFGYALLAFLGAYVP